MSLLQLLTLVSLLASATRSAKEPPRSVTHVNQLKDPEFKMANWVKTYTVPNTLNAEGKPWTSNDLPTALLDSDEYKKNNKSGYRLGLQPSCRLTLLWRVSGRLGTSIVRQILPSMATPTLDWMPNAATNVSDIRRSFPLGQISRCPSSHTVCARARPQTQTRRQIHMVQLAAVMRIITLGN